MTKSTFKGTKGLKRIWNACHYSLAGVASAYQNEPAFRQEVALGIPLIIIALILPVDALSKALMICTVILVLIMELINSAIEAIVDRISLDQHELSKRAKDIGSAAVFFSLINCVVVWGLVLFDQYS